jgi:hypothetical protein
VRGRLLVPSSLLLLAALGPACPETYGIGGEMDEAIRRDIQEGLEEHQRCEDGELRIWSCTNPDDRTTCKWRCP